MAIENYPEMRDTVRDPQFHLQRALSLELERRFPQRFVPRYSMVMFHDEIPYGVALERGRIQNKILAQLTRNVSTLGAVDFQAAQRLIEERLTPIGPSSAEGCAVRSAPDCAFMRSGLQQECEKQWRAAMRELAFRIVNVFTQNRGPLTATRCACSKAPSRSIRRRCRRSPVSSISRNDFRALLARHGAGADLHAELRDAVRGPSDARHCARVPRARLGGDDLKLEMQAGIIPVRADGDRWTLQANAPTWRKCEASRGTLAKMLGLTEADIGAEPLWVKAGKEQLVIPLTSERACAASDAATFAGVLSEDGHSMAYVFAELAQPGRLLSRFFFPSAARFSKIPPPARRPRTSAAG